MGALRHRLPAEDVLSRDTLLNVEEAGRNALTEMRRLLDAMRREGDELDRAPQPGLGQIAALLEDVRAAVSTPAWRSTVTPSSSRPVWPSPPIASPRRV